MSKNNKKATGLNAKEMRDFKSVNNNQFVKINEDYKKWIKKTHILDTKVLIVFLILSGAAFFYFSGWPKTIAIVIAIYSLIEISKREGHREGYMDGYSTGRDEAINDAYGIDDEQAKFIEDVANDMELDEDLKKEDK